MVYLVLFLICEAVMLVEFEIIGSDMLHSEDLLELREDWYEALT